MERLLVLGNIRRRRYLLLNIFRVKMDILLFPEFFPFVSGGGLFSFYFFNLCVQFLRLWQSLYAELLQGLFAGNVKLILFLMLSAIEGRILGIFFIFYDFPESAVSGALFFDQLFRLYLLADFINLVPGGGNGTVHICDMLLKILVV